MRHEKMLNLHLYFVKFFGCVAVETEIPMPLEEFGTAIRQRKVHPHIYVGFGRQAWFPSLKFAGPSDVYVAMLVDRYAFAVWFLTVGQWQF